MSNENKKGVEWGSLVFGIMFVVTSLVSFRNPLGNLVSLVVMFAVLAIIKGGFEIYLRNRAKKLMGYNSYAPIIMGVINIILGVYFFFHVQLGLVILPFVFAIWFISDSVFALMTAGLAKTISKGFFWFTIIVNIVGIIIGIGLLLDPISSALTISFLVGAYFMVLGIKYIVQAFR